MSDAPRYDRRRQRQLYQELLARARVWLPQWQPREGSADFGQALLQIAARLEGEVTQRLDRLGDKNFRGFLHWLGVRGAPAHAARMPVVFTMAKNARPVLASQPVRVQALSVAPPVVFETQRDLLVVPARPVALVAADAERDAFFRPPPGLFDLTLPAAEPTEWLTRSLTSAESKTLQLDPALGLRAELILSVDGAEYRVLDAKQGIVRIEPPLERTLAAGSRVERVAGFDAYGATVRNRQEHALFLGDADALNIEAGATLEVLNAASLPREVQWSYWDDTGDEPQWRDFDVPPEFNDATSAFVLKKTQPGAIGMRDIDGRRSRWLRARFPGALAMPVTLANVQLRINCPTALPPPQTGPLLADPPLVLAGLANTTPLVLDTPFYPFGIEPRRFDAFYLSCPEAFSKADAEATLDINMADPTLAPLIATAVGTAECILFGIGVDQQLHRIRFDTATGTVSFAKPVRPPLGENAVAAAGQRAIPLVQDLQSRPAATVASGTTRVAVVAEDDEVWLWNQPAFAFAPWLSLGRPFGDAAQPTPDALQVVMLERIVFNPQVVLFNFEAELRLFALRGGTLQQRTVRLRLFGGNDLAQTTWSAVPDAPAGLARIVPVLDATRPLVGGDPTRGFLAVTTAGTVHRLRFVGTGQADLSPQWSLVGGLALAAAWAPLAVSEKDEHLIVVGRARDGAHREQGAPANDKRPRLAAFSSRQAIEAVAVDGELHQGGFDFALLPDEPTEAGLTVVATVQVSLAVNEISPNDFVARWRPFSTRSDVLIAGDAVLSAGLLSGPPNLLPRTSAATLKNILVPGDDSDVLLAPLDLTRSRQLQAPLQQVAFATQVGAPQEGDVLLQTIEGKPLVASRLRSPTALEDGTTLLELELPIEGDRVAPTVEAKYEIVRVSSELDGVRHSDTMLVLDTDDAATQEGSELLIHTSLHDLRLMVKRIKIKKPDTPEEQRVATFEAGTKLPTDTPLTYVRITASIAKPLLTVREALRVEQLGDTDRALVRVADLYFMESQPAVQRVGPPLPRPSDARLVLLNALWSQRPGSSPTGAPFVADDAQGDWQAYRPQGRPNPELSWEYWNGKAWLKIDGLDDGTEHLLHGGVVKFCVPDDLAPTEVAGSTGHWIRARLVGGDYGQAEVVLINTSLPNNTVSQRVERNPDAVRAPLMLDITVNYSVCCPVTPQFVIALNNGGFVDQSDANRTAGASVAAFVPLRVQTQLLDVVTPQQPVQGNHRSFIPADCARCEHDLSATQAADPIAVPGGRALYLGCDAELSGTGLTLLFVVEEQPLEAAFPLVVEVLRRARFETVLVEDGTRGLSESGILTLSIPEPPTRTALFGEERFWLRIRPNARIGIAPWLPKIRGVFINAALSIAAETQTLEFLGSSDGSPNQRVALARPPVVNDSLALRVREPLSDEQIDALLALDPNAVKRDLPNAPGAWVLWREVVDPQDAGPAERVYSLDDAEGVIQFGDGLHGAIPPLGRDVLLAERYQRSGDARANQVSAFSRLNAVTALAGVEAVTNPLSAAGGADAQDAAATLRTAPATLRHRNRAVTLRDLEQMALQSSPQIVQARATSRAGSVRIVAVGRAPQVRPKSEQLRALREFLLERAAPQLFATGRLQLRAPELVALHVDLTLLVEQLESSAALQRAAEAALQQLFDPASGGLDGTGWPLGALPTATDVAAVLTDLENNAGIAALAFSQRLATGELAALPVALRPDQLIVLDANALAVRFVLDNAEVQA